MVRKIVLPLTVLLVGLLAACQTATPTPTAMATPWAVTTAAPTLPPLPTTPPTATPTPTTPPPPAQPAASLQPCVSPQDTDLKTLPLDSAPSPEEAVLQALNQGMPAPNLARALQRAGLGGYPFAALPVDMDGDHFEDVLVSLILAPQSVPPQGMLLVYICRQRKYTTPIAFMEPADRYAWGAPVTHFAQDMNADGRTEVVVSSAHCAADGVTCQEKFAILGWRDGHLIDLLANAAQPFPAPVATLADPDRDGRYDLIIQTGDGQRLVWHYRQGKWRR